MKSGRRVFRRLVQLSVLVLAGFLFALAVVLFTDAPWMPSARWVGLIGWTATVFFGLVREYSLSWRALGFWLWMLTLLGLHVAAYSLVLTRIDQWRLVWFFPLSIAEYFALLWTLDHAGYEPRGGGRRAGV